MARKKKLELPSGSFRKLVYVGKGPDGKRKYKSFTAPTRADLDLMVASYRAAAAAGETEEDKHEDLSVSEAVRRYIDLKRPVLSPATVRGYTGLRSNYISRDSIAGRSVSELTQRDIQLWISNLAEDVSPKTVRNAYALLLSSVKMFRPEASFNVTLPQKKPADLYCPSDSDVKSLLSVVKDSELEIAILLAAFGPMRRSEICALESSDIKGNCISITKALVQNELKEWELKEPKTVSSRRQIEMPDFVIEKLRGIEGRIIKSNPSAISDRFQRAIQAADCPRFRFHDLRHYGISIMHAIGVPDKYIMARSGHTTDGVMKRVYQNVIQEEQMKQTKKINDHFTTLAGA